MRTFTAWISRHVAWTLRRCPDQTLDYGSITYDRSHLLVLFWFTDIWRTFMQTDERTGSDNAPGRDTVVGIPHHPMKK